MMGRLLTGAAFTRGRSRVYAMKCARCGVEMPEGSVSCPGCGLKLRIKGAPQQLGQGPPGPIQAQPDRPPQQQYTAPGDAFAQQQYHAPGEVPPPPQADHRVTVGGPAVDQARFAHYGGFWIRFAAAVIDALILEVAFIPIEYVVYNAAYQSGSKTVALIVIWIPVVVAFGYYILMTGAFGATLGKMALGLRVIRTDGTPVGYGRATIREFAKILSGCICYIGYIMAGFDERKQALHDKIASTFVIVVR